MGNADKSSSPDLDTTEPSPAPSESSAVEVGQLSTDGGMPATASQRQLRLRADSGPDSGMPRTLSASESTAFAKPSKAIKLDSTDSPGAAYTSIASTPSSAAVPNTPAGLPPSPALVNKELVAGSNPATPIPNVSSSGSLGRRLPSGSMSNDLLDDELLQDDVSAKRQRNKDKHVASENRRRNRLRAKIAELQDATQCAKRDTYSILESAIHTIQALKQSLQAAQQGSAAITTSAATSSDNQQALQAAVAMLTQQQQQQQAGNLPPSIASMLASAMNGPQKLLETMELMPTCLITATGDIVSSNNRFSTLLQIPSQIQTHIRLSLQMIVVSSCYTDLYQALQLVTLQGCAAKEMTFMINTPQLLTFAGHLVLTTLRTTELQLGGAAVAAFIVPNLSSTTAQSGASATASESKTPALNQQILQQLIAADPTAARAMIAQQQPPANVSPQSQTATIQPNSQAAAPPAPAAAAPATADTNPRLLPTMSATDRALSDLSQSQLSNASNAFSNAYQQQQQQQQAAMQSMPMGFLPPFGGSYASMLQPPNFQQFMMQPPQQNPFLQNPGLAFNPMMLSQSGGILSHPFQSYFGNTMAPPAAQTSAPASETIKAPE